MPNRIWNTTCKILSMTKIFWYSLLIKFFKTTFSMRAKFYFNMSTVKSSPIYTGGKRISNIKLFQRNSKLFNLSKVSPRSSSKLWLDSFKFLRIGGKSLKWQIYVISSGNLNLSVCPFLLLFHSSLIYLDPLEIIPCSFCFKCQYFLHTFQTYL